MQIVIDIPEEEFGIDIDDKFKDFFSRLKVEIKQHLMTNTSLVCGAYELEIIDMFLKAFNNGTPLPKGHGRIGDLDALENEMINGIKAGNLEEGYEEYANINNMNDCVQCVKYADTIIEADIRK